MNENACFSLYAVEANVGELKTGTKGQDYHAFLALVAETPGQEAKIIDELHFKMQVIGLQEGQEPYIFGVTRQRNRNLSDFDAHGYIGGSREVMVPVWNKAIDIGWEIGELQIPFSKAAGPKEVNCRAGVKAVIETLGLEYEPVLAQETASKGTQARIIDNLPEVVVKNSHILELV